MSIGANLKALPAKATATKSRTITSALLTLAVGLGGGAGVDYSFSRPSTTSLQAAGATVVARYIGQPSNPKDLTAGEAATLHKAGLGIVLNFEAAAGNAKGGAAQGKVDGRAACVHAAALGVPSGLPIYYSIDFDVTSQMSTVRAYITAAGKSCVSHPARAYGEYDVCQTLANWCWQTYAWSGGKISKYAAFYQFKNSQTIGGAAVDYDAILNATHLGAWMPPAPKPAPTPTPKPAPVAKTITTYRPTIVGRRKVGHVLDAIPHYTHWTPGVVFHYQWLYGNGVAIKGATRKHFQLTSRQKGRHMKVRVYATRTGYTRSVNRYGGPTRTVFT